MKLYMAILHFAWTGLANHHPHRQGLRIPESPSEFPTAASPAPLSASTVPGPVPVATVTVSVSEPAASGPGANGSGPVPASTISGPIPASTAANAKCGKGYTYCGFMLQSGGHNFSPDVINKTYCDALEGHCVNGIPKTKTDQAVFLCMDDNPATIQLFCACGGKCLDEPQTNNIAHCDAPCVNGGNCF